MRAYPVDNCRLVLCRLLSIEAEVIRLLTSCESGINGKIVEEAGKVSSIVCLLNS